MRDIKTEGDEHKYVVGMLEASLVFYQARRSIQFELSGLDKANSTFWAVVSGVPMLHQLCWNNNSKL